MCGVKGTRVNAGIVVDANEGGMGCGDVCACYGTVVQRSGSRLKENEGEREEGRKVMCVPRA